MSEQSRKAIESFQKAGLEFTKDFSLTVIQFFLVNCKYCGKLPTVADVGGVNPYYRISCPCGKSPVVGSYNKKEAIDTWNILNERSGE